MGRAPCCDKANVKRGPWSPEEDARLKAYLEEHGTGGNWITLPAKISLKRCGKSCRLRWLNYLRPDIRHGSFSEEEERIICSLYISIGSRWSIIAAQLPGRTDNDIKNYWNTRLKKKLLGGCRRDPSKSRRCIAHCQESSSEPTVSDQEVSSLTLSSVALERMQLNLQLQGLQNMYNNPAFMWHSLHTFANNRIHQGQAIDATVVANPIHTEHVPAALVTSYPNSWNPVELDTLNYASMSANTEEDHFQRSNINQLEVYPGMDCGNKNNVNRWGSNPYNVKSSSSSRDSVSDLQPDSMLQDYVLYYD